MSPRADEAVAEGTEPEEIELKLTVADPAVIGELIGRPPAGGIAGFQPIGPARTVRCLDRYFDTSPVDGALRRAGVRARLREQDGAVILAVKASIETLGAVSRRVELQGPAVARLDPAAWPPSAARSRIQPLIGDGPLVEIAALRQTRLQRNFTSGTTTVEISLDQMTAMNGRRMLARRSEVEAELLAGEPALLQDLAAAIGALPGVGPATGSKLAFALNARLAPVVGPPPSATRAALPER